MKISPGTTATTCPPLHTQKFLRRATFNRLYMVVYTATLVALLHHHTLTLLTSSSTIFSLLFLLSDLIFAFSWVCTQAFHFRPIRRQEHPENLDKILQERSLELPAVDIFICTADPNKEPPIGTVNTALSVMAYDYPPEKVSVYVSDDGGSQATLFAFMEAAKFASHWLPFCRENSVMERCPEAYFGSRTSSLSEVDLKLKTMYETMKSRVENSIKRGKVEEEYVVDEDMRQVFMKWTDNFTRDDHPTIIEVLVERAKNKDVNGQSIPNLVYVSREKSKTRRHHFKAGALNTLVRVSATMTNAPIILTLDCDNYSNDPQTLRRTMCYFCDPLIKPTLAYVQYPQICRNVNKGDIYFGENKRVYQINPLGLDGLRGPDNFGTGCFFQRRAFFGGPSTLIQPEIVELGPNHSANKSIESAEALILAHHVAACSYEDNTEWGTKLGFRYGSLVEDYYTGYRMHCEGWRSIFCNPERAAFLGDNPVTLIDLVSQCKRWMIGVLAVLLSRYSTLTYGVRHIGFLMSLCYTQYAFWPFLSIPFTIYAFMPQIALLNGISTFPKASDPWFSLYIFLFIAANGKDLLDFLLEKGTVERWWNSQRMWMIYGLTSFLFGGIEYTLTTLGIAVRGFDITSKLQDEELSKRYGQGKFEFGVASPMFVSLIMAALINLTAFVTGVFRMISQGMGGVDGQILQIMLSAFGVINCWPIYDAIVFRSDNGRMPTKTILTAAILVSVLYICSVVFVIV